MRVGIIITSIFIVCSILCPVYGQSILSKKWTAGNNGSPFNYVKASIVNQDTLYYVAYNRCKITPTSNQLCHEIGKMDKYGNIISSRNIDWFDLPPLCDPFLFTEDDHLLIASGDYFTPDAPQLSLMFLDKNTLDSIADYRYDLGIDGEFYAVTSLLEWNDSYVISGWSKIRNEGEDFPDFVACIDKVTMEIDTILSYPFRKISVIPEEVFVDSKGLLTVYFSGLDILEVRPGVYGNAKGFMKYDEDFDIQLMYLDTLDDKGTGHGHPHAALIRDNGDMIYKHPHASSNSFDVINRSNFDIISLDSDKNLNWISNDFGYSVLSTKEIFNMINTEDGNIVTCGRIRDFFELDHYYAFDRSDTIVPDPQIYIQGWEFPNSDTLTEFRAPFVMKIDGDEGSILWQYNLIEFTTDGGVGPSALYSIHELSDGSLMAGGQYTNFDSTGENAITLDSWVTRLPPSGCFDGELECNLEDYLSSTKDLLVVDVSKENDYTIYPNPNNGQVYIKSHKDLENEIYKIKIRSVSGKLLAVANYNSNYIDIQTLPDGVLIFELVNKDNRILQTDRVIKL